MKQPKLTLVDDSSTATAWPADGASPKARLLHRGPEALQDRELVELLIATPRAERQARELLENRPLSALLHLSHASITPLTDNALARLIAAVELAKRLQAERLPRRALLDSRKVIAQYLRLRHASPDQEVMGALYLDGRHRLIRDVVLFRGTIDRVAVEPRAIFKRALELSAKSFVLFHNHPTGDPSPSDEDIAFTRRLAEAGELFGISMLCHLILGSSGRCVSLGQDGRCVSLRQDGRW